MRSILFSICIAALTPVVTFAASDAQYHNTATEAIQNQHKDAIQMILQDHKQITKMIAELERNLGKDISKSREMFGNLKAFLEKHESMEQDVWYPELEKHDELKNIVVKRKKEEQTASEQLKAIDNITDDKDWKKKVKILMNDVKKHAQAEEKQLLPKARKALSKEELNDIGDKMSANKD